MSGARRLGLELSGSHARGVLLEERRDGYRLLWYGTVSEGSSGRELLGTLQSEMGEDLGGADEILLALPTKPSVVYQPLELPPLEGDELRSVARDELRREMGAESLEGLELEAWQYGGSGGTNTLTVGVPSSEMRSGLSLARAADPPVTAITTPAVALHHGLCEMGSVPGPGVTGITYLGVRFGFVVYVQGRRWILLHHFPVGEGEAGAGPEGEGLTREVKQSFMFLRSRSPGAELGRIVLCGPGLPPDDLGLRLEEALPDAEVEPFSFDHPLDLHGVSHAGEFLPEQGTFAVALMLAAHGREAPVNFLPREMRVPRLRRRLVRQLSAAGAAGLLAVALHAGFGWWTAREASARQAVAEERLAELRPRLRRLEVEERYRRAVRAGRHMVELSGQQRILTPEALREVSRAVPEGTTIDSLHALLGPDGLEVLLHGRSAGGSASGARRGLDRFLRQLRGSPVFLGAELVEQDIRERSAGRFDVRFAVRARLLRGAARADGAAGDGAGSAEPPGEG